MRYHEVREQRAYTRRSALSTRRTEPVVSDARCISTRSDDAFERDAPRQLVPTFPFQRLHKPVVTEDATVRLTTVELRPVSLGHARFNEAAVAAPRNCFRFRELPQDPFLIQPRHVRSSEVRPVTTVRVGGGTADQPRSHRIQMNVSYKFQKIAVRIDENCLIAPLKQVAAATLASVHPPRVAKGKVLDDGGKTNASDLQDEVCVVRHPAIAVDTIPISPGSVGDERFKLPVIRLTEENPLAAIAAQDDVVHTPRNVYSPFPRHGPKASTAVWKQQEYKSLTPILRTRVMQNAEVTPDLSDGAAPGCDPSAPKKRRPPCEGRRSCRNRLAP